MSEIKNPSYDPLDISKFSLTDLPPKKATKAEKWMKYLGLVVGVLVFLAIYFMPTPEGLTLSGQTILALFAGSLILWITEPIPLYYTSFIVMVLLVLLDGWDEHRVMAVLGNEVSWLNLNSFILSAGLLQSGIAKRAAIYMISKFGHTYLGVLGSFLFMNLVLAAMVPSTVARAAILLPMMMMASAIYGSTQKNPNNFAKILFLQNLHAVNGWTSAFLTGANAHILAVVLIVSMTGEQVYYSDWFIAAFPVALVAFAIDWFLGGMIFKLKPEEKVPQLEGGMARLKEERQKLGPVTLDEKKALAFFVIILFFWSTDRLHLPVMGFQISAVMTAFIGAILMLTPKIGLIDWQKTNIPWHLLIFSAGAYACGFGLNDTRAAQWAVQSLFEIIGLAPGINFWVVYVIVIFFNMFSHLFFTSTAMRVLIFIPFVITMAKTLGFAPLSLALPATFTILWVIGLPISGKPNVLLYSAGQFSAIDCMIYGLIMTFIVSILLVIAGFTWFSYLEITPAFW